MRQKRAEVSREALSTKHRICQRTKKINVKAIRNLLIISLCSLTLPAFTQAGWEAGPWMGVSYYFGDLNTNYNLSKPNPAGGIIARYNYNTRVCLKFGANYGQVEADDATSSNAFERARNLSFRSTVLDGSAQLEFNFLPYVHGSKDEFFSPYIFAGFNVFYFNPKAEYQNEWVELRPLGTEGQFKGEEYYTVSGGIVYGGGFKISLNYEWSLNIELSARQLFTDYLDDVSTTYPDMDDLRQLRAPDGDLAVALSDRSVIIPGVNDAPIGEPGRQRGNASNNDSYVFLGVGLVYYFGDIRCPEYGRR